MVSDFNLNLLVGGIYTCTPSWNKKASELDRCRKFYFPFGGEAELVFDNCSVVLDSAHSYYISGYNLREQSCDSSMDLHWVHFRPVSPIFDLLLSKGPSFFAFPDVEYPWVKPSIAGLEKIFVGEYPEGLLFDSLSVENVKIQGVLLFLLSQMVGSADLGCLGDEIFSHIKLKEAIDYMNEAFLRNPTLAEIAEVSGFTPNYFHKIFKTTFNISPFEYMQDLRLRKAMHLLVLSCKPIYEVATESGYSDEFYFSKIFKKVIGLTPSDFRRSKGVFYP
ncbi:MAG: helix-turn-helix transcriptional regulator [Spirochaetales bacterium]|nr:helix-turn-helix transcriptional regulator [Spirochaetales bacterium]